MPALNWPPPVLMVSLTAVSELFRSSTWLPKLEMACESPFFAMPEITLSISRTPFPKIVRPTPTSAWPEPWMALWMISR